MAIEVLEPAPDKLLTTVAKFKVNMGITKDDNDEIIEDMIAAASDFVVRYTGRDFALQTVRESLPGKGTVELILSLTPLLTLEEVTLRGQLFDDCRILDREGGYITRRGGFISTAIPYNTIDQHPSYQHNLDWEVTYQGGYVLPGWDASQGKRTLPYDLERAVIEMVKSQFQTRGMDGTMKSYRIGDTSIVWERANASSGDPAQAALAGIPASAISVLNWFRRAF